ncbi:MAG: cyclic nucleotide-binding domain-containing protein [Treponema sp.]|jgi:CRP-like cAMP-binding protein|nr:cyclic nucleotide-binding domain-containing protein [Treponema sp.]
MQAQFQPAIVNFAKNSCITVEGKANADRFYIIQKGRVRIIRETDTLTEQHNDVAGPGDIFGVVSVMASCSYIETVLALTDVTLLAIEKRQYGDLIKTNTPVAMNIIQQFSRRLRSLDDVLSRRALSGAGINAPSHLFQVAEYYVRQEKYGMAFYAYRQYLNYCSPEDSGWITEKIQKITPYVKDSRPEYPADQAERNYPENCLVFAEGEYGDELYIITKGTVKITKIQDNQEMVLAVLKKGDIFGEMALLEDKPRAASVETCEDCTLMTVNRSNFESLISRQPEMVARLTTMMAERIWIIYKQLVNTLIENPLGRIYDALLIQLEKERVVFSNNQSHLCSFGFKELAGMVGLPYKESEPHFRRILASKRISLMEGKILISDVSEVLRQTMFYRKTQKIGLTVKEK